MQEKTDTTRMMWIAWWTVLLFMAICTFTNCSKHHPHEPPEQAPPDTVFIIKTVIIHDHHNHPVTCDTVNVTVEFILIKDQSAPNIYGTYVNYVEYGDRIVISETSPIPVEVMFIRTFARLIFGDVITIRKIEGSRAETIGSSIIGIECSGGG